MIEPSSMPADSPAEHSVSSVEQAKDTGEKLALVIPTLREAQNIGPLLDHVRSVLDPLRIDYEIMVVDDDSRDGTEEIVSAIALKDPRVRLLVRRGQRGMAGALLHAWQNTDAPILGAMDADLQHPPELLPKLIASIHAGHDLAIGSRYTAGGELGDWHPVRRLLSAVAVWATWPIQRAGLRTKDPMAGFYLVRRQCIDRISFQRTGFRLLLEILVRGRVNSVEEIPIAFGPRYGGASKAGVKVAFDYARLLAKLYAIRLGLRRD